MQKTSIKITYITGSFVNESANLLVSNEVCVEYD